MRKIVLAIDFDGTIVQNKFPLIGKLKDGAKYFINLLHDKYNCEIIIWTCRQNQNLQKAKFYLTENGIKFDYINQNSQTIKDLYTNNPNSRKIYGDLYIDDRSIFVNKINWSQIFDKVILYKQNHITDFV